MNPRPLQTNSSDHRYYVSTKILDQADHLTGLTLKKSDSHYASKYDYHG